MKKHWVAFGLVITISFSILGLLGRDIYFKAPPIPKSVLTTEGATVLTEGAVTRGQNVWQALGGMELGSIWGHGSYVAPDWTADWLHRELVFTLDEWAKSDFRKSYTELMLEDQARLRARLKALLRTNTYDAHTGIITVDPVRQSAFESNLAHYTDVFTNGRTHYALPRGTLSDSEKLRDLAAFFWWTSWAASTNRPGQNHSYTSNWPHEPLIDNRPTGGTIVWTGVSIIVLLAGIGAMVFYYAGVNYGRGKEIIPAEDPLLHSYPTQSQRAVIPYFWVSTALILVQILAGVVTAHYGVEGDGFYGIPLSRWLPYSVLRTWHVQLGIFWIATTWLASGLFIGPIITGQEPKGQTWGIRILLGALILVVAGSMTGEWMSIFHKFKGGNAWFYLGHQGYEYIDLGRLWQWALFAGLLLWLALIVRSMMPAFRKMNDEKPLLGLFLVSTTAIALFYGAGLTWGQHTHLTVVEYWRWWVVHLWVEGFFEVFATVTIAYLFTKMGLIHPRLAAQAALFGATIYLSGGIIGTLHHLYFSGTSLPVIAFGAVFSALEVVPLVLISYDAWENIRVSQVPGWIRQYRWPIYFFVAVAFWNLVGAGLFGFMINPPIALYYMQGLNTTPVHGHAALFGVYGMLGIGLMLFCLRAYDPKDPWKEGLIRFSFWGMNVGLFLMCVVSLLPVGLLQTWASVERGYWYARSPEFLQTKAVHFWRWMRVPGDTIFALGALALVLFIGGLATGRSYQRQKQ